MAERAVAPLSPGRPTIGSRPSSGTRLAPAGESHGTVKAHTPYTQNPLQHWLP